MATKTPKKTPTRLEETVATTEAKVQDGSARLFNAYDELSALSQGNLEAVVAANQALARGAEEISKDLRDDYTALNHSVISYVMLNATALALGDQQTADLAERNVKDNAAFVVWINNNMPKFVIKDLQDSGASIDQSAVEASQAAVKRIWNQ